MGQPTGEGGMRLNRTMNVRRPFLRGRNADWKRSLRVSPWLQAWVASAMQAPVVQWAARHRLTLSEAALYIGAYLVYVFSRGLVYADPRAVGIVNGGRIADFQERVGFLWEPGWQAWAIEHAHAAVVFLNWAYILTYWPVILGLAIYLFFRDRSRYYYFRSAVLINLIVALLTFMLFPVASPFAIPGVGLVDTIQAFGPAIYGSESMATFYNTSAAMPSLHFSWTIILGVYWLRSLPGGFKVFGLVYPALTFFAITITGNHFILDAIMGGVLAGLSFGAVEAYRLARRKLELQDMRAAWGTFSRRMKAWQMYRPARR